MMTEMHCHSRLSDGSLQPETVVRLAAFKGIDTLSITDHDCVSGTRGHLALGEKYGIHIIPGVELSAVDPANGRQVHVLCYQFEDQALLDGFCEETIRRRAKAGEQMVDYVTKRYPISEEFIYSFAKDSACLYKQHIMMALMESGYTDHIYSNLYQKLFDKKYGEAFVPIQYPDVREACRVAREAGGKVVIAHPGHYHNVELVTELAKEGRIDGIEVEHPRNTLEDSKVLSQIAAEYSLIVTGGTDFHGMYSSTFYPIGSYQTKESQIKRILAK